MILGHGPAYVEKRRGGARPGCSSARKIKFTGPGKVGTPRHNAPVRISELELK
jgi:hypothetical protein